MRVHVALALLCIAPGQAVSSTGSLQIDPLGNFRSESDLDFGEDQILSEHGYELDEDDASSLVSEASYAVGIPASQMADPLGADMGEVQVIDGEYSEQTMKMITEARNYLQEVVNVDPKFDRVRDSCVNKHSHCAFWSALGECQANPGYMKVNCAPVCQSCDQLHVETRCPVDPDAQDALYPGDLNAMFERIISDPEYQQYEPVVVSRPTYAPGDGPHNATYDLGMWLITFENALSGEEAERLIELGHEEGYERSSDVGEQKEDGTYTAKVNEGRTSTNAWCIGPCMEDPIAQRVMERIENITGIPEANQESLQLLRYEEGQFYQSHNDFIPHQRDRPCGVRMLTFYMYLNDVEEGGSTYFPKINKEVQPKRGRAVLWPSVHDNRPNRKDVRSDHEARPVIKGVKFGANAWIHQRDFKTPNKIGCS